MLLQTRYQHLLSAYSQAGNIVHYCIFPTAPIMLPFSLSHLFPPPSAYSYTLNTKLTICFPQKSVHMHKAVRRQISLQNHFTYSQS
jgi:hypothetical protein